MKKQLLFLMLLVTTLIFTSCDDEDSNPTVSFSKGSYLLLPETPLEVEATVSEAPTEDLVLAFDIDGTALKETEYTLSAEQFVIKAGQKSAKILITPKENFEAKVINLSLRAVKGYDQGNYSKTIVTVNPKRELIYTFVQKSGIVSSFLEVEVEIKPKEGDSYLAISAVEIPFIISSESTAVKGEHFAIEGDVSKFIIEPGKKSAKIKVNFLKNEIGKEDLVLEFPELSKRFFAGNYIKTKLKLYGNTTKAKIFGNWKFKENKTTAWLKTDLGAGWAGQGDIANLPENNTDADKISISRENDVIKFTPNMTGDMSNYFRNANIEFLREFEYKYAELGYPWTKHHASLYSISNVNFKFSENAEELKAAEFKLRVFEENGKEFLEVTIDNFKSPDFLMVASEGGAYPKNDDIDAANMELYPIRYVFERAE